MLAKNEGILAPKPLGRGIWPDFYALFPGDLEGFCLIVKTYPRGCPGGQPPGKLMISALRTGKTLNGVHQEVEGVYP